MHPLHPPPRSAPDIVTRPYFYYRKKFREDHMVIMNELEKRNYILCLELDSRLQDKPRFGIKHTPSHPYLMENVTSFLNW